PVYRPEAAFPGQDGHQWRRAAVGVLRERGGRSDRTWRLPSRQPRQDLPPMRLRLAFLVAAFAVIVPAAASGAVHIRSVDTATAGRVRVTVVTDQPTATAPTLREDGKPVSLAEAPLNLGSSKSVLLAIDRSQSMGGTPLNTA